MKPPRPLTLTILTAVLLAALGGCQNGPEQLPPVQAAPDRVTLPSEPTTIPMPVAGDLPFVEVRIDGAGPFSMVLDTGAEVVLLTPATAAALPQSERTLTFLRDDNVEAKETLAVARVSSLRVGQAEFGGFDAIVREIKGLSEYAGRRVDGIIGIPVIGRGVWTFDYPGKRLTISSAPPAGLDPADALDLSPPAPTETLVNTQASCGGEQFSVLLDTGSTDEIDLCVGDAERFKHVGTPKPLLRRAGTVQRTTFFGARSYPAYRFTQPVRVGPLVWRPPPATVEQEGTSSVGSGAFKHARLTLDVANHRLWIESIPQ